MLRNASTEHKTKDGQDKGFMFKRNFQAKLSETELQINDGVGYRSPCVSLQQYQGSTSPAGQGRSVREFEEQMATLRKENFNLKLRLYFIEESIPGYQKNNSPDNQETIMKQLIDAKVEMEILRKDIQEKQDVLKEAAQAINQMENIQRDTEAKSQALIDELKQKLHYLEIERDMEKSNNGELMNDLLGRSDISENLNAIQRIRELEGMIKISEEKVVNFQNEITKLDEILTKRDETITEYEDKVKELVFQNAELLESLESKEMAIANAESQHLREELQKYKVELANKICMLQEAEEKLRDRTLIHENACRTIQQLLVNIKSQQAEINKLKNKNSTEAVTGEAVNKKNTNDSSSKLQCTELCRSLSDSEAFIELCSDEKRKLEAIIEEQNATIKSLKTENKKKTANLQNLVNNELWEKNREIERLIKLVNKNAATTSPVMSPNDTATELQHSFSDLEYAKALERNKLLQRKVDVLIQRLDSDRKNETLVTQLRNDVRDARAETESAEKWRRNCADDCALLSTRLEELAGFLDSLLRNKDVVGILSADRRRTMRKAVDRSLDLSKSLNMSLSFSSRLGQLSNYSEILAEMGDGCLGAEENRTFNSHEELHGASQTEAVAQPSIEALKAENQALKNELDKRRNADPKRDRDRRSLPTTAAANSESEAWSEPDRKVSLARIGLHKTAATVQALPLTTQQTNAAADTDSESDTAVLNQSRASKTRSQERIVQLEQMITQRDDRILEIQCQLVDADNHLKQENLRVLDMTHELLQLRQRNDQLHADLMAIGQPQDEHNEQSNESLLRQIDEKTHSLAKIQEERDRLEIEARFAEMEITALKADMDELQRKHIAALAVAAEQQEQQFRDLEQRLQEMQEREEIARSLYEESKEQLAELQRQYVEAQRNIDYLNENEQELKQTLVEGELAARSLKKQLDESALQASKVVLDCTKALHDKAKLEECVQQLKQQLCAHETERSALQQQVIQLEDSLQQATTAQRRQNGSDVSHSGYTSEEVLPLQGGAASTDQHAAAVGAERQLNPSPDLGIESDAGRVSSVELCNAQRSLLKTVEFDSDMANIKTEMKTDLQEENVKPTNQLQPTTDISSNVRINHDCAKVEQENEELRRKLIRTKRAFEDTYKKLRIANERKAQIEKDIKNQILKTHYVLKNVRSNMENDL